MWMLGKYFASELHPRRSVCAHRCAYMQVVARVLTSGTSPEEAAALLCETRPLSRAWRLLAD